MDTELLHQLSNVTFGREDGICLELVIDFSVEKNSNSLKATIVRGG
jgi:hypothetical protein